MRLKEKDFYQRYMVEPVERLRRRDQRDPFLPAYCWMLGITAVFLIGFPACDYMLMPEPTPEALSSMFKYALIGGGIVGGVTIALSCVRMLQMRNDPYIPGRKLYLFGGGAILTALLLLLILYFTR